MMKIIPPKGLYTKVNRSFPMEDSSIDVLNMYKDSTGNVRKLEHFVQVLSLDEGYIDVYYYSHEKHILVFYPTKIIKIKDLDTTPIVEPVANIFADATYQLKWTKKLSFAEYGKNVYIADPTGAEELMKYDGKYLYRAGVPYGNYGVTSGSNFLRLFLSYKDSNGVESFGDYEQFGYTNNSIIGVFYPNTSGGLPNEGGVYPAKFGSSGFTINPSVAPSESNTKTVNFTYHNFQIGDVVFVKVKKIDDYGDLAYYEEMPITISDIQNSVITSVIVDDGFFAHPDGSYPVTGFIYNGIGEISSITATITSGNITGLSIVGVGCLSCERIYINSVGGLPSSSSQASAIITISSDVTMTYPTVKAGEGFAVNGALSQMRINMAISSASTYGYMIQQGNFGVTPFGSNTVQCSSVLADLPLEDIYDDTVVKGIPPKFKFITMYANQMIGVAPKDTDLADTVYWSDLGIGSSIETFAPFDCQTIGKSSEGDGQGVFANVDHIVVFKKRDIYYLYGTLYGRQYRIVKSTTEGVGCVSHKTITPLQGGCTFLSDRGLYHTTGQQPVGLSAPIEPNLRSLTKESSMVSIDYLDDRLFMIFNEETYEYNCDFKEWFKNNLMNGNSLLCINENKYLIKQDGFYKQEEGFSHEAYYRHSWITAEAPVLKKKFNSLAISSSDNKEFTVSLSTFSNWKSDKTDSLSEEKITSDHPVIKIESRDRIVYSQAFQVNGVNNEEDLVISSIAIEYEEYQSRVKDR